MDNVPARRWWALASAAAAQFIAVVDTFIVNVAIPSIRADLHAGAAEIQAVVAVYQIAYAALVITGGRLGDIVGRKRRGGMPPIDLALLDDCVFMAGMSATFCFFLGNLSFYFVLTLYLQNGLGFSPFDAALTVMPLAFAFVAGSRVGGRLIEGCVVQGIGLASTALLVAAVARPGMTALMPPLALFGCGQGMVLAPLFSAVLAQVRHAHAGSGAGILTTTQQVANGTGVVLVGAVYFAVLADRWALLAAMTVLGCTVVATVGFLLRMRPRALAATAPVTH
jgi:predicted MFS family arabinose efflux permease